MAGMRDDSAGDYGQWINPQDQSWLDYLKMKSSDVGGGAYNALANITGALSPIGTSEQGNMALQVPPMVTGLVDSAKRIGQRGGFTRVPELDEQLKQDLSNVVLSLYGGNALTGLAKRPAGSVGMFAGVNAKTADHAALAKAQEMTAQGVPREQIWNGTGWFKGPDDKWRFEIDDSKSYLDDWGAGVESKLGDVFDHKPALDAYPNLATIDITASRGDGGSFDPSTNSMSVDWSPQRTSTALHEVQHAVQGYEGFSPGSSPDRITNMGQLSELRRKLTPDQLEQWNGLSMEDKKMLAYRAQAGEVEARSVQKRMNLTPEERQARPPWLDYDIPENQQIVRLLSDTGKPNILGSALATAGEQQPIRAYRGATNAGNIARDDASILWGSSSPDVASTYARPHFNTGDIQGAVAPLDVNFSNPLTVDAQNGSWVGLEHNGQRYTADDLAILARDQGHDGLIVKNVMDAKSWYPGDPKLGPADNYVALKRGTVKSPLTGETLFSDTGKPNILGSALATAGEQPRVSLSGQHPNYQIMNDGSPVGRAYVREYPETIQLGQLHVDPEFQRQGIATEAQRLLAQQYGKPTVPDVNLSQPELARWRKNDPAAVADYVPYFEGTGSFMPAQGTDAYWASQGSGVVPGTRAARGELFSRPVPLPPQQDDNLPPWLKF